MYNINFYDRNNNHYDFAQFTHTNEETAFDKLAECLEILYNLHPINQNWKTNLLTHNVTLFACGLDAVVVRMSEDGLDFNVTDV